jgi:peptidoglycan/LPS O-acetylase OafA/YrhL
MSQAHNDRLQSLRGMAALCVLGGHSALIVATPVAVFHQQIFQPNAAVVLFYVLSGYVLSLSLTRDGNLLRFAIRRLFRILPVYWLGIFVCCGSYLIAYHPAIEGATQWFNGTIVGSAPAVQWANIRPNLTVWSTSMSGVLWSVQVEMFTAPLIPLMLYVSRRVPIVVDLLIIAALAIVMKYFRASPMLQTTPQLTFVAYLLCFYLGVTIPRFLAIGPGRYVVGLSSLAVAALLFSICICGHAADFGVDFYGYLVLSAFISTWIVAYVAAASRTDILSWRPLIWLGDVSYSFYAYGTPIMMVVALWVFLVLPAEWRTTALGSCAIIWITFIASLAVTLPLAWLSYRFVELPLIAAGRGLTSTTLTRGLHPFGPTRGDQFATGNALPSETAEV